MNPPACLSVVLIRSRTVRLATFLIRLRLLFIPRLKTKNRRVSRFLFLSGVRQSFAQIAAAVVVAVAVSVFVFVFGISLYTICIYTLYSRLYIERARRSKFSFIFVFSLLCSRDLHNEAETSQRQPGSGGYAHPAHCPL